MSNPFKLAMSPLTRTVYAGRVKQVVGKNYSEPVGVRHDVTNDFYAVLIQMADSHGGEFIIRENGTPAFEISVKAVGGISNAGEAGMKAILNCNDICNVCSGNGCPDCDGTGEAAQGDKK